MYINPYRGRFQIAETSEHFSNRIERKEHIAQIEDGKVVRGFYVNRYHMDGPEIHWIFSNGLIVIVNAHTKVHVTTLIARPGQVRRYYDACHLFCPDWLLDVCRKHQEANLNNDAIVDGKEKETGEMKKKNKEKFARLEEERDEAVQEHRSLWREVQAMEERLSALEKENVALKKKNTELQKCNEGLAKEYKHALEQTVEQMKTIARLSQKKKSIEGLEDEIISLKSDNSYLVRKVRDSEEALANAVTNKQQLTDLCQKLSQQIVKLKTERR